MPRFYFDIRDGAKLNTDEEGIDLPDLPAAKSEATHSLADLTRDIRPDGHDTDVSIEVRQNGEILFRAGLHLDSNVKPSSEE